MSPKLARFLRLARTHTPAERERKAQRIDFAWSNAADKKFLKEMVPHHKVAVKMADTVIKEGSDIRVDALARAIRDGQAKEIEKMEGWLKEVGEKPYGSMGGM